MVFKAFERSLSLTSKWYIDVISKNVVTFIFWIIILSGVCLFLLSFRKQNDLPARCPYGVVTLRFCGSLDKEVVVAKDFTAHKYNPSAQFLHQSDGVSDSLTRASLRVRHFHECVHIREISGAKFKRG